MITKLSPNFYLAEFTLSQDAVRKGINNDIPDALIPNAVATCSQMELVRSFFNNVPILVSSGYRSPQVNADVGGQPYSAHTKGCAMDFNVAGKTPWDVVVALKAAYESNKLGIAFDQIIYEFGRWVHFGIAVAGKPRYEFLTIDKQGTRVGLWEIRD